MTWFSPRATPGRPKSAQSAQSALSGRFAVVNVGFRGAGDAGTRPLMETITIISSQPVGKRPIRREKRILTHWPVMRNAYTKRLAWRLLFSRRRKIPWRVRGRRLFNSR
jgi:hypothetical protein